jgi:carbamoyltransferase
MKILSISAGHDSSVCILDNGKITYYQMGERNSRKKHDRFCTNSITNLIERKETSFDIISISYIKYNKEYEYVKKLKECFEVSGDFSYNKLLISEYNHHLYHAYCGFYNSNFNKSLCIVVDGSGSYKDPETKYIENLYKDHILKETESVFVFEKGKNPLKLFKHYYPVPIEVEDDRVYDLENNKDQNLYEKDHIKVSSEYSVGWEFEKMSLDFGFDWSDAGKVMGLAQYKGFEGLLENKWIEKVNPSNQVQKKTQEKVLNLIKKYVKDTGIKNVVITGGYGLNCVANYYYINNLKDINLYVDPICFDAGISIGSAYHLHQNYNKNIFNKIKPLQNVFIGYKEEDYDLLGKYCTKVSYDDVVDLISDGNVVALFQGRSEAGQRALGNRSLLFDPRVANGKDAVNRVKKRESFRPFAGSILEERFEQWFETSGLKTSKYMQYAIKVKEKYRDQIPSVIHADGTCRIQTVSKKDNLHFYNLIKAFYKKTNVPVLLNTSFNLAGDPLVETFSDAYETLKKSKIEYLYLPEKSLLIYVKN